MSTTVRTGTRRDAVLFAAGANATHGLRRTNADKRRAVEVLLADEEWSTWSDRKIAKACGVTHPFVAKVREEKAGNSYRSLDDLADELDALLTDERVMLAKRARVLMYISLVESGKVTCIPRAETDRVRAELKIEEPEIELAMVCAHAMSMCLPDYWRRWVDLVGISLESASELTLCPSDDELTAWVMKAAA